MVVSVKFDAEMGDYEAGITDAIKAIRDWESQTGVSALNVTEKFEDAVRGVVLLGKETGRSTDDIERALEGLGFSADDAKEALEAIGREAPREMGRAEDAVKELGDAAEDAGDKASTITDKTGAVGDGLRDLGSIARDVLEGDFGSAAGSAIEAIGGLAGAITGGVAGGAIATALGSLIGSWVDSWDQAAKDNEQRVKDMYDDMLESGNRYLSAEFIQKGIAEIVGDQDKYNQALALSKELGVDVSDAVRAMAGDTMILSREMDDQVSKRQAEVDAVNASGKSLEEKAVAIDAINAKYDTQYELFNEISRAENSAASRSEAARAAQSAYLADFATAAVAAGEATQAIDQFGDSIVTLPDGRQIYIDAETGQATSDTEAIAQKIYGIQDKDVAVNVNLRDNATAQMDGIISRLQGRSVTVGVGTVLKDP